MPKKKIHHLHEASGYAVKTQRGPQLRWCAHCGAVGIYALVPGRRPHLIAWIAPDHGSRNLDQGVGAEAAVLDAIKKAVAHTKRVSALPAGHTLDSLDGGVPQSRTQVTSQRGLEEVFERSAWGVDVQ